MPGGSRKKPFSGKQKKLQLQSKRDKQHEKESFGGESGSRHFDAFSAGTLKSDHAKASADGRSQQKNEYTTPLEEASNFESKFFEVRQPTSKADAGRYALVFRKESKEEVFRQREEGRKTLRPVLEEYLECKIEDFFSPELDFPVRPPWNYDISREQIERNETRSFQEYLKRIDSRFERSDLSYFELNLETWRQLWRVLEMSDIVLYVVDIRYPALLFPPKLYDYVCKEIGKRLILVLNKIDICPAPLVLAWQDYFKKKYPELEVLSFTSYPSYNLYGSEGSSSSLQGRKRRGRMRMAAEGALEVYKVCAELVQGEVDLTSWKEKILDEMKATSETDEEVPVKVDQILADKADTQFYNFEKYKGGILTIGCVGQPNVGKSSLINALMGKKVVSVSRTPGHTKHFQTIFLTPNVRLCDCPGLIFPSKIPKALQVLCGSFPIAQLREPYTTVKYLGERLDLPKILKISHPDGESEWSACDVADGWAAKRGYHTAKAARLDTYRGANHILRLALEGRICLCLYPPDYCSTKDEWGKDERIEQILNIQAKSRSASLTVEVQDVIDTSDEETSDHLGTLDEESDDSEVAPKDESESAVEGNIEKKTSKSKSSKGGVTMKNKFALLDDENEDSNED